MRSEKYVREAVLRNGEKWVKTIREVDGRKRVVKIERKERVVAQDFIPIYTKGVAHNIATDAVNVRYSTGTVTEDIYTYPFIDLTTWVCHVRKNHVRVRIKIMELE